MTSTVRIPRSRLPDTFRRVVAPSVEAIKRIWLPMLLLQVCGLLVVVAYFNHAGFARACGALADLKNRVGVAFAIITLPIASAIVPELFKAVTGVDRSFDRRRRTGIVHNVLMFAVIGVMVDLLYRVLAHSLGEGARLGPVVAKVLIDQFLFTTLLSVPFMAICYDLRHNDYALGRTLRRIGPGWYVDEVVPLLIPCWAYWFPMTTLMYLLPANLTFIYGACASAASATMLVAVASRERNVPPAVTEFANVQAE